MSTAESTAPSHVSMKSDRSMYEPLNFGLEKTQSSQMSTAGSTAPSHVSMKSDGSMYEPLNFGLEKTQSSQMSTAGSTAPSGVSMKSDGFMYEPLNFGLEKTQSSQMSTAESTAPSHVSMKSDGSMYEPLSFGLEKTQSSQMSTAGSTAPSHVSMKSDRSISQPLNFGLEKTQSSQMSTAGSTAPSHVSMKSDGSMYEPLNFGLEKTQSSQMSIAGSTAPSGVSMKSDGFMYEPLNFGLEKTQRQQPGKQSSCSVCEKDLRDLVQFLCGHWSCKQCVSSDWDQSDSPANYPCPACGKKLRKHQGNTDEDTAVEMAEKRKRKWPDSTASGQSSFMSEEPISSCSDPSISSQMSTAGSTAPSHVSMKSDGFMYEPLNFGLEKTQSSQMSTAESTAPSHVSMKSDRSILPPLNFGLEKTQSSQMSTAGSTAPSHVSMKSDRSILPPLNFGLEKTQSSQMSTAGSTAPSHVSMKSDRSILPPLNFGLEELKQQPGKPSSCSVCEKDLRDPVQFLCGHWSCKQCVSSDWDQSDSPANYPCPACGKKFRKHQGNTDEDTDKSLVEKAKNFKRAMQKKFGSASEGIGDQENSMNSIYTSLYITTGESTGLHEEHEFRYFKPEMKKQASCDEVDLHDIFKALPGQEKLPRTVLTKGVAGIGKSFAVQKFILDWAEEEANLDIDFVFILAFRELNLIADEKSLHELLTEFHPAPQSLKESEDITKGRVIVILDGLDESRFQMDFKNIKKITSVSEVTSVGDLLANLIQGSLLPNAQIWITSRPAAANQIPAKHVDMVTEIRGFNDPQKEEYFRKKFSRDSSLADRIISHIWSSQSLDIMCQTPIFCWISAVLFQEVFGEDEKVEIPQTLTEMMAHFLFAQTKRRSRKYDMKTEENKEQFLKSQKEFLMKLGKLAFVQLLKNNLIFYEEDFEECGIDIKEAAIYSGFCTAVLREEKVFSQQKVFFFVHLTIQEFFAALYVYDCFTNKNTTELSSFLNLKQKEHTLLDLLKMTVDKVLEEKNGHLDFFLRFLLGLMAEANRKVLQGLLTSPDPSQDTDKKILTYLKAIRRKNLSPDSCINLFQTMVEMRDHKVKDEIQEYPALPDQLKSELTPLHCSALAYMIQVSKNDVEVLYLKSYNTSDEGRRRLIPAVRSSRKAILADCKVTAEWVKHLAFGLKFPSSPLRDLDLSNNDLKDVGVELLCDGLSSQCCRLKTLRLSGCQITETGCASLAKALKSNPSHLIELDLSYNDPGVSGEDQLSELKRDPHYKLNTLNVEHGGSHRMKPGFKKYACELTLDPKTAHKNLHLSEGNRKVTWMEEEQSYRNHSERFDLCPQVLCEQGLDKRCYWEIEVVEPFKIGVTYRTIGRKGDGNDCKLGQNDKSWCMFASEEGCYVMHNSKRFDVASLCSRSSQVGVYLDWPAGTLSFYRVSSDSRTRLHTFKTKFVEPLYPAVEFHTQSSALFCQLT